MGEIREATESIDVPENASILFDDINEVVLIRALNRDGKFCFTNCSYTALCNLDNDWFFTAKTDGQLKWKYED